MKTAAQINPNMPPDELPGYLLLKHREYGTVIAFWDKVRNCYLFTGRTGGFTHGSNAPFVFGQVREEQVNMIEGWAEISEVQF